VGEARTTRSQNSELLATQSYTDNVAAQKSKNNSKTVNSNVAEAHHSGYTSSINLNGNISEVAGNSRASFDFQGNGLGDVDLQGQSQSFNQSGGASQQSQSQPQKRGRGNPNWVKGKPQGHSKFNNKLWKNNSGDK